MKKMKVLQSKTKFSTFDLASAGVLAALYVALTLPFAFVQFGPIQFRLSEMLVVLPILMPMSIPGLTLGCLIANILNPNNLGIVDIVFGSLATFLAATVTRKISLTLKNKPLGLRDALALFPPVLFNALIVGTYLVFLLLPDQISFKAILLSMLYIGLSEIFVVYLLGWPFLLALRKTKIFSRIKKTPLSPQR